MIFAPIGTLLMATVGLTPLFPTDSGPTLGAAIPLSAITMATDPENRVAAAAHSLSENNLALIRHPRR
jgi:hypothetical protein